MSTLRPYTGPAPAMALHLHLLAAWLRQALRLIARSPLATVRGLLLGVFLLACALAYGALALPQARLLAAGSPRVTGWLLGLVALGSGLGVGRLIRVRLAEWHRTSILSLWPLEPASLVRVRHLSGLVALALPLACVPVLGLLLPGLPVADLLARGLLWCSLVAVLPLPLAWPLRLPVLGALSLPVIQPLPVPRVDAPLALLLLAGLPAGLGAAARRRDPRADSLSRRAARPGSGDPGPALALLARAGTGPRRAAGAPPALALGLGGGVGILLVGYTDAGAPGQGILALLVVLAVLNRAWERIHAGRALLRLLPMDTRTFLRAHLRLVRPLLPRLCLPMAAASLSGGAAALLAVCAAMACAFGLSLAGVLLHLVSDGHKIRELLAGLAWVLPAVAVFWVFPPLAPVVLALSSWRLWGRVRSVRESDAC